MTAPDYQPSSVPLDRRSPVCVRPADAPAAEPVTGFDVVCRQSYGHNAAAAIAWEGVWGLGVPSCLLATVIPSYLLVLGASKLLIQSVMIGMSLAVVMQFVGVRLLRGPRRKQRIFATWCVFCGFWLLYGLSVTLLGDRLAPHAKIALFVLTCAGLASTQHLGNPTYAELLVENIPLRMRGKLGSLRMLALGACGLLGVYLSARLMQRWPEPLNFEYTMIIGAAIMMFSCMAILAIRDHAEGWRASRPPLAAPLDSMRTIAKNLNFRFFLVFYAMLVASQSLAPLLLGYGADVLGLPAHAVSHYTAVYFVGQIMIASLVVRLADRYGFRLVALIGSLIMTLVFAIPLVAGGSSGLLIAAYLFYAGSLALNGVVLPNIGAEMLPGIKPSMVIAVGSCLIMPLGLLLAPMAGRLVDVHGHAGYLAVFLMGSTLAGCAAIGFAVVVREPRSGQEFLIRIRRV